MEFKSRIQSLLVLIRRPMDLCWMRLFRHVGFGNCSHLSDWTAHLGLNDGGMPAMIVVSGLSALVAELQHWVEYDRMTDIHFLCSVWAQPACELCKYIYYWHVGGMLKCLTCNRTGCCNLWWLFVHSVTRYLCLVKRKSGLICKPLRLK